MSEQVQLVLGLGNPGIQYVASRHNLGFMAVEKLAEHYQVDLSLNKRDFNCLWGKTRAVGRNLILALPQTYMNLSGEAAHALAAYFRVEPAAIVAVYDDLDLNFGRIKISLNRGSGGHRGISSLIRHLQTEEFARLRLGIGRPQYGEAVERYVLSGFYPEQKAGLDEFLDKAKKCLVDMVEDGVNVAMQTRNRNT